MNKSNKQLIKKANDSYIEKRYEDALLYYIIASLNFPQLTDLLKPSILRTIHKLPLQNEELLIIDTFADLPNRQKDKLTKRESFNTLTIAPKHTSTDQEVDYIYEQLDHTNEIIKITEILIKSSAKKIKSTQKTPAITWLKLIHAAITQNRPELTTLDKTEIKLGEYLPRPIYQLLENLKLETLPPTQSNEYFIKLSTKSSTIFQALYRINADENSTALKYKKIINAKTNIDYISQLFLELLDRLPQSHEISHYTHTLETGEHTRHSLAEIIITGEEHKNISPADQKSKRITTISQFKIPRPWELRHDDIKIEYSEKPIVSIVIPVYEKPEYTIACIRSIAKNKPDSSFEIIVLDDQSPDNSSEIISKIQNITVIKNKNNLGFLKSCNEGIPHARGEYIFLLNNDTAVFPNFLDTLLKTFTKHPDAGVVGSKLLYPNGTLQEAGGILWNDGSAWNYGRNQNPNLPQFNYLRKVDYCSGAAIMFKKKLFADLGKFDESLAPAYYEDTDFAFKVRKAGLNVYIQPKSLVIHHEGVSHGTSTTNGLKSYQERNAIKFKEKWENDLISHYPNGASVFYAKDRAFTRSTIIIIDHYIPQIDKDAGSRSTWHLMRALKEKFENIKFWPDNHYYDTHYARHLEDIGIEVLAGDSYVGKFSEWLAENHSKIKIFILNRPHISEKYIDIIKQYKDIKIIYYGHDIHYKRLEMEASKKPVNITTAIKKMKEAEESIWSKVDVIYYPSEDEKELIDKLHPNLANKVKTIPVYAYNEIELKNTERYNLIPNILFVGGFRHTPNIDAAKRLITKIWPQVLEKIPNARLTIVGSHPPKEIIQLKTQAVNITGYVSDEKLDEIYNETMICVAPLDFGGGMKGKIIEAMKYGIPVVTNSVGSQGLSRAKDALILAESNEDFANHIINLVKNKRLRNRLSKKSFEYIKNEFSETALINIIKDDFN